MRVVYGNFAHTEFIGRNWLNVNGYFIYTGNMFFSFMFRLNLVICQASLEDFVQFVNKI